MSMLSNSSTSTISSLRFTLSPQATSKVHDSLVCLSKFSEFISLEARREKLCLSALNSSKSAYGAIHLTANKFFDDYQYLSEPLSSQGSDQGSQGRNSRERFSCRLQAKALLTVFRHRGLDSATKDTNIDRVEFLLDDSPNRPECRILVKIVHTHGVLKTYKLTYEEVDAMHALFDREAAKERWTVSSAALRGYMEHFGPRAEQLDIAAEGGRVGFTSFTERLVDGKEILKQPLQTSVTLDTSDFDSFSVTEGLHIAIALKDFRAITLHADALGEPVSAAYSIPGKAMQLYYGRDGMACEFTLMTTPEARGTQQLSRSVIAAVAPGARAARERKRTMSAVPEDSRAGSRVPAAMGSIGTGSKISSVSQQPPGWRTMEPTPSHQQKQQQQDNQDSYDDQQGGFDFQLPPEPSQQPQPIPAPTQIPLPRPPPPPSPPMPTKEIEKPLFLLYESSSEGEDEDELERGLDRDVFDLVNWDTMGSRSMNESVKVARDVANDREGEGGGVKGGMVRGRKRTLRNVVMDEEDEMGGTQQSEGVAPTQQSRVKGLFD